MMPFFVGVLAVLLVVIGIAILVIWFTGPNRPAIALFASPTPTATLTFTPTPTVPTATPTLTATEAPTATVTISPTPSGPFEYTVKEGDTCWDIAANFKIDVMVMLALNNFAPNTCPIQANQKILIPSPDQELPTATPLPANIPAGTKIEYIVQLNDSLVGIAAKFNTTTQAIMAVKDNNLTDQSKLIAGQKLIIPVNLITRTPTKAPTATLTPTKAP